MRAAKFSNNVNESGWETLTQRRLIARICALFKAHTVGQARKAIGNRLLKSCYLKRGNRNQKIRTRKQRTDVGKFSFVNRSINQLPASLLASCPWKLNTFRNRVKNVVTGKGIQVGLSVSKWSDVKCSDGEWSGVIYVKWYCFEVKRVTAKFLWIKVLCTYIRVTLYWGYWLYCDFHYFSYTVFVLICSVVVLYCFVMCGCVWVL